MFTFFVPFLGVCEFFRTLRVENMADLLSSLDATRLAQLHKNCYKVMKKECTVCKKKCAPKTDYVWALVSVVTEDNFLNAKEVYLVKVENLRDHRSQTFATTLGKDGGKRRVSFSQLKSFRYVSFY